MAFLKYCLVYTVCAVAVILYQSDFAHAAVKCVSCENNATDTKNQCNNSAVNTTTMTNSCDGSASNCGAYTYKDSDDNVYTVRGCNITCDKLKESIGQSHWGCEECSTDLCNAKEISSGSRFGISLISLLISTIVALNCY